MEATLKVHKWHTRNVCIRVVKVLYEWYQSLSIASRPLTLLWSNAEVAKWQVAKTGKSSIFWLHSFFLSSFRLRQASTIVTEAITTIQTQKNKLLDICTHHLFRTSQWLSGNPTHDKKVAADTCMKTATAKVRCKTKWGDICMLPAEVLCKVCVDRAVVHENMKTPHNWGRVVCKGSRIFDFCREVLCVYILCVWCVYSLYGMLECLLCCETPAALAFLVAVPFIESAENIPFLFIQRTHNAFQPVTNYWGWFNRSV